MAGLINCIPTRESVLRWTLPLGACFVSLVVTSMPVSGQLIQQAIGGVAIDAQGQIRALSQQQRAHLAEKRRAQLASIPGDLAQPSDFRAISLRQLQSSIRSQLEKGQPLSDEVRYLGGLQRVEYVFLYPEQQDIVFAGPAEGWKVNETGDVVGRSSGQPVVHLDDLVVALRTVRSAAEVGITCSIDPTPEGRQALSQFLASVKRFTPAVTQAVEKVMGPQTIRVTGVPQESHFAQVLVASDFRMKRLAMNLDPAPIADLPGFLDLLRRRRGGMGEMMPRWWMACDYDAVAHSPDKLSWKLSGQGVKVLTEDEIVHADGSVSGSGQVNPVAQEWAETMTGKFGPLSKVEPVFGQLRNLMDLCVLAALIEKENLADVAQCDLSLLADESQGLEISRWTVPKTVATQSSFVKKGREFLVTASGGVFVDSWSQAAKTNVTPELAKRRPDVPSTAQWRWNPAGGR